MAPFYCVHSAQTLNKQYMNLSGDEQGNWLSEKKQEAKVRAEVTFILFVRGESQFEVFSHQRADLYEAWSKARDEQRHLAMMFATRYLKCQFWLTNDLVVILMCFSNVIERLYNPGQFFEPLNALSPSKTRYSSQDVMTKL